MAIHDGDEKRQPDDEGEDEGSASKDGSDDHLKDDQKPLNPQSGG